MEPSLQQKIAEAIANPRNVGEMVGADAVGTVGSPDCGDMLRMWVKFREQDGRKVIDKATFQTFGCETAIAVASVATEMIAGKTVDEALAMDGSDLSAPLGPLPPMKIHCAALVESALRNALKPVGKPSPTGLSETTPITPASPTLIDGLNAGQRASDKKIVLHPPDKGPANEEKTHHV